MAALDPIKIDPIEPKPIEMVAVTGGITLPTKSITEAREVKKPLVKPEATLDEVSLTASDLETYQRDVPATVDIMVDANGKKRIGYAPNLAYAVSIQIPPREYDLVEEGEDEMGQPKIVKKPRAFDVSKVKTLKWRTK